MTAPFHAGEVAAQQRAGTRAITLSQAGVEEVSVAPQVVARKEPMKEKTPRVDFR
jgi:hypothetical protein